MLRQQRGVRSPLDNLPTIENEYLIGVRDRRKPVCDHNTCSVLHHIIDSILNQAFTFGIKRRGGFIQN